MTSGKASSIFVVSPRTSRSSLFSADRLFTPLGFHFPFQGPFLRSSLHEPSIPFLVYDRAFPPLVIRIGKNAEDFPPLFEKSGES